MADKVISVREFYERTGVGRTTTYKLLNNNTLKSIKVGSRRLILVSSVEALLQNGAATKSERL